MSTSDQTPQWLADAIREICETEPANPDHPQTVCIDVADLRAILHARVPDTSWPTPEQEAEAAAQWNAWADQMNMVLKPPRPELLTTAEQAGATITGKPDGSEPVSIVFSPEAWRKFDMLTQTPQQSVDAFVAAADALLAADTREPWSPRYMQKLTHAERARIAETYRTTRAALRPGGVDMPRHIASLHITSTDTYPEIEVEVHEGALLQPSMSPVKVYADTQGRCYVNDSARWRARFRSNVEQLCAYAEGSKSANIVGTVRRVRAALTNESAADLAHNYPAAISAGPRTGRILSHDANPEGLAFPAWVQQAYRDSDTAQYTVHNMEVAFRAGRESVLHEMRRPVAYRSSRPETLDEILTEYRKGCSNTQLAGEGPEQCSACVLGFVHALEALALREKEQKSRTVEQARPTWGISIPAAAERATFDAWFDEHTYAMRMNGMHVNDALASAAWHERARYACILSDVERKALDSLLEVAGAAYIVAEDSEDEGHGYHTVDPKGMKLLSDGLDMLDELPDDQPGYAMEPRARAAWALRRLLGSETALKEGK